MEKLRILIGCSVCQNKRILEKFLNSLKELELSLYDVTFKFIDDNEMEESSKLLNEFDLGHKTIITKAPAKETSYYIDNITHYWNDSLVLRVAKLKNEIIDYAINENYDYLFLIDSDLIIDSNLIKHLTLAKKDIISEIFWTAWQIDTMPLPNVWLYDKYEMVHPDLDEATRVNKTTEFLTMLKSPGVYEVGGLGACTLISADALKKGINFSPVKNISFWGEDRWFCIRAAVLGIDLFVDTHYPAKHLYRESDLE